MKANCRATYLHSYLPYQEELPNQAFAGTQGKAELGIHLVGLVACV